MANEVRGIARVNGSVAEGQFLTAKLSYFVIDEVDGTANIANFGFTAGVADPGEALVQALQEVALPVIIESSNARVMYAAFEVDGVTAAELQASARLLAAFPNVTVTAGSFTVV